MYKKIIGLIGWMMISHCALLNAQFVTTVAGQLQTLGSTDGDAAIASFNNCHGIALDKNGNLYIADRFNHLIRKIDVNGIVSTVAGVAGLSGNRNGPANQATFNEPWGIYACDNGILFVADTRNNRIRKIMPNGTVSTYAGTGSFGGTNGNRLTSSFGNPVSIDFDSKGQMFVSDHLTHVIRKIDTTTNLVSTIAGAVLQNGFVSGAGAGARFNRPYGIKIDKNDNIIVADEWNHAIRKISPTGTVTTIAGNGLAGNVMGRANTAQFKYPWAVLVDSSGNVFVADGLNYTLKYIDKATNQVSLFAGISQRIGGINGPALQATFTGITSFAYNTDSTAMYLADAYNHTIRKITFAPRIVIQRPLNTPFVSCRQDTIAYQVVPTNYSNYTFLVNGVIAQQGPSPKFSLVRSQQGAYRIRAEVLDANNNLIAAQDSVIRGGMSNLQILLQRGTLPIPYADSIRLQASVAANSYLWSTGQTTSTIKVNTAGNFTLTITDVYGCQAISPPLSVTLAPAPTAPAILFNGPYNLCPDQKISLQTTETTNIQWLRNGLPIPNATQNQLTVAQPGSYQVRGLRPASLPNLSTAINITQTILEPPIVKFSETSAYLGRSLFFSLTPLNNYKYQWLLGDGTSSTQDTLTYTYKQTGQYTLSVIYQQNQCVDTLILSNSLITIKPYEPLLIPNAFSPNGDGISDYFRIESNIYAILDLSIYNHWSQLLYNSNSSKGWDGTINGDPAPADTYLYILTIKGPLGEKIHKGYVTLTRND
jgi:gliding motility-associated-like protein